MAILLFLHFMIIAVFLIRFFALRDQTGFHLGMNITMITGGFTGLITGAVLIDYFPFYFIAMTILSAVTGACVGAVNGLFYDSQSALTGLSNGLMMGLMGPMLGAAGDFSMIAVVLEAACIILMIFALSAVPKS
ncbi:hypothetical protein [Jeotgalibacillus terrae]|uniref:Uncharacterized protein n=1 Tax=Jeotgalibacillus terrae TaxID=587735 RepID=A0ABW5ZL98_9BACL|nr:hypothetical protein [Jeotgalibacillus terrae]MBM7580494.1 hypothetical protein [Jeotgalibacillus terrae]